MIVLDRSIARQLHQRERSPAEGCAHLHLRLWGQRIGHGKFRDEFDRRPICAPGGEIKKAAGSHRNSSPCRRLAPGWHASACPSS
jgi:hypothetical protein